MLALVRHFGIFPRVVEYLKAPPSRAELAAIFAKAGLTPQEVVRRKGTPYVELGLDGADEGALLDAMIAHPILINRPLAATDEAAALCRPSDVVLDLLPVKPGTDAFKEDGAPFLRDARIAADDPGFAAALGAAILPVDDLGEPGRTFFSYASLSGEVLGYGGFELYGPDVFLRSIVVAPQARGRKIGRNLAALLLYRAFRQGARTAWLLTTDAAEYFAKLGFKRRGRQEAPVAIRETRQAKSLCPSGAALLSKPIGF